MIFFRFVARSAQEACPFYKPIIKTIGSSFEPCFINIIIIIYCLSLLLTTLLPSKQPNQTKLQLYNNNININQPKTKKGFSAGELEDFTRHGCALQLIYQRSWNICRSDSFANRNGQLCWPMTNIFCKSLTKWCNKIFFYKKNIFKIISENQLKDKQVQKKKI